MRQLVDTISARPLSWQD